MNPRYKNNPQQQIHTRPPLDIVTRGDRSSRRLRTIFLLVGMVIGAGAFLAEKGTWSLPAFDFQSRYARDFEVTSIKLERGMTALSNTSWTVSGTVINRTTSLQGAPDLDVRLLKTDDQKEVAQTRISLGQQALPKGAGVRFSATLRGPAGQTVEAHIRPIKPTNTNDISVLPDDSEEAQ